MSRQTSTGVPVASVAQALGARDAVAIDLRAPVEHARDRLPGAVSLPLFDDDQRALIGTLYSRGSPEEAFAEGARSARGRVGSLVAEIARHAGGEAGATDLEGRLEAMTAGGIQAMERELEARPVGELPPRPVVLYCWRGGLRSRSVVGLLRSLGLERAVALEGGYRAFRRAVIEALEGWEAPPVYVLRGLTGVGKTLVLRELERQRPGWTLDLEACAGHRSSLLGMVGLEPAPQKLFESRLADRLRRGFPGHAVFEGESRKVGDALIPTRVWEALDGGCDLELTAPLERRVQVLMEDYLAHETNRGELGVQLAKVERLMGPKKYAGVLTGLLEAGREAELVEILLERWYDPRYRHGERDHRSARSFDSSDPARAAREIAEWIEGRA